MFLHALRAAAERKLDLDVLNNGISYFLGPLLGWTLPGIVVALVRHIRITRWKTLLIWVVTTITDSNQVPVGATSQCSTHCYFITQTPAASVDSMWTQCREIALRMAGRYPTFRYRGSAARSHQVDGDHILRFGIFIHVLRGSPAYAYLIMKNRS